MRKPHRKQLLAWLLTAALLLTHLPVSVLSEEIIENSIQTEIVEQNEPETAEEPNLSDFPTEEPDEPIEPPVSEEPNETPEPSEPSGTMEIPADENTPDIPDQDESETPEPSDSDIEETPSPEVPEETPDTDSTDGPPAEETPIPEESPLPDDEEAFSVSEALLEYGYAYAAANAESIIYEDTDLTTPLFTLKEDGGVLLITEETETAFKVWWLTYADEPLSGYLVREHGETAGYVFEEITLDATVKSDETTDLSATNQPVMTRIRIKKRDKDEYAQTGAPSVRGDGEMTGATFRVLAGADILDRQGNMIWLRGATVIDAIQTSGEDAAATTDELWPGLYEIVEIAPPVGYQPSDERMLVDTASAAAQSREAVVTYDALRLNEIKLGTQAIVKVLGDNKTDNQHTETPEEGAEFHVYLRKAGSYENAREFERDHLITDKSGYAKTKLLPYGVYVLEQTVGKDGFEIKKPILFEITGEENPIQPPILTLNDRPILYRLRLIKTDARTGKTVTLAGASFKLKDADGNTVTQTIYYPKKQTLDAFTTDESGCVTLPEEVGWGPYSIEEIQAPEGYLIRTESLPVFVGKTGDTADQVYELDIEIPNEAVMGQISLEKKGLQLVGFETQTEMGFEYQSPVFEERCLADAVFEVKLVGLPLIALLTLMEWLGIFALGISQFITNKLAALIFFIACCCLLFGKVTFREAAAVFAGSFCIFILPYAAERILERISDLNRCVKDWVRG